MSLVDRRPVTADGAGPLLEEIRQYPKVYGLDRFGSVHLAHDKVYRLVGPAGEPVVRHIVAKRLVERLVENGLVETEVRYLSQSPEEAPSIVEHRRIPFVTSPPEWSPTMLLEAARLLCSFSLALAEHGLMLKDGHAQNVTFHETIASLPGGCEARAGSRPV